MRFKDIGIVISKKSFTEKSFILKIFTEKHGIYSAILYNGKNNAKLHEGSLVDTIWSARLEEHLGRFKCDIIKSFLEKIYFEKSKIFALKSALNLIKIAFKEKEPQVKFFQKLLIFLNKISQNQMNPLDYVFFEIDLLEATGYGIDTSKCTVTGKIQNLQFLSPKSGKAVCYEVGLPYKEKLFLLPECLIYPKDSLTIEDLSQSLRITSYFIKKYIYHDCNFCNYRNLLINYFITNRISEKYNK